MSLPDDVIKSIIGRMAKKRGEHAEQKTVRIFRQDGWSVGRIRRGPIDVIAAKGGEGVLVQVKSGQATVSRSELETMLSWGRDFKANVEVWHFRRTRVEKRRVYAPKPKASANPSGTT
jgi:Holliday junction resolvase